MTKAILKINSTDKKLKLSKELNLGSLWLEDTANLIKSAFVDLTKDNISSEDLFNEILFIAQNNVLDTLTTELNNDLEYGIEEGSHLICLNKLTIDLVLV
jgi:hypothetical protein